MNIYDLAMNQYPDDPFELEITLVGGNVIVGPAFARNPGSDWVMVNAGNDRHLCFIRFDAITSIKVIPC